MTLLEGGRGRSGAGRRWAQGWGEHRQQGRSGDQGRCEEDMTRQVAARPRWAPEVGRSWPQGSRRGQKWGQDQGQHRLSRRLGRGFEGRRRGKGGFRGVAMSRAGPGRCRARAGGGGAEARSAGLGSRVGGSGGGGGGDAHKSRLWLHWCSRRAAAGRRGVPGAPAGAARAMSRGPAWPPRGRRAGPVPRRPRPRGSGLGRPRSRPPPGSPRTAPKRRSARCSTCCAP